MSIAQHLQWRMWHKCTNHRCTNLGQHLARCHGKTLSMLTWHYYKQAGLVEAYSLDLDNLYRFISGIEAGCGAANPYHNRQGPYVVSALKQLACGWCSCHLSRALA